MKCKNCGRGIPESANFCRYCGANLSRETVPAAPLSSPILLTKSPRQPRILRKNSILWIVVSLLVALTVLLIFLLSGKSKPAGTRAPTEPSLAEQFKKMESCQEYYERGQAALQQQDYENAIAAFESALAQNDADDTVRFALAEACFAAEQFERALSEYETLAKHGTIPYYEERTQCCIALNQPEKAGTMLHTAYLKTGDEAITALEEKYWNADALHAYGEYIGYDGNYAFGLFDWNHDLTPELMYVYNATDYGTSTGASVELWTWQSGELQQLYNGRTSSPGVSLTADDSIFVACPATNGHYRSEQLYWDDNKLSVHSFLDCYLEGNNFTEYTLFPEHNYFWSNETMPRGSFVDHIQVSYAQYEQALAECTSTAKSIPCWPVTDQNCRTYLNYDWNAINGKPENYTIKKLHYMDHRSVANQFGTTVLPVSDDAHIYYGVYALTRSDTGGIMETFTLPFDDAEMYNIWYGNGEDVFPCTKQTDVCTLFELWYGIGMVCNLAYDSAENRLYELDSGSYDVWNDQLIYSSLTYDTDSAKTIEIQTIHSESVCTLLSGYARSGYAVQGDCVYIWGWNLSKATSYQEVCDMEIWQYTRGDSAPTYLVTVPAYCIVDVNSDSITYRLEWDGEDYTIPLSAA